MRYVLGHLVSCMSRATMPAHATSAQLLETALAAEISVFHATDKELTGVCSCDFNGRLISDSQSCQCPRRCIMEPLQRGCCYNMNKYYCVDWRPPGYVVEGEVEEEE
jgi:hypothetical protein